jgi:glycerol-3-phosphate O-acyltransferase / dihydroxyacetone phosphate acyltransferase
MDSSIQYKVAATVFSGVLDIFFREAKSRGSQNIPKEGPVIFVCAPHANQFVDPLLLIKHAGRQVGFLAAKKSMDKVLGMLFLLCWANQS